MSQPPPLPHPEAEWRAHLAAGRFMLQRSRASGAFVFYPRIAQPGTGAQDLEWVPACGEGRIHAATLVRRRNPAESYNVVLVDLAEGPRLMSRVDGIAADAVTIGMPVKARIIEEEGQPLLVFVPA
ncbi:MAG TPA: OB-fold domain-containing protein [Novosphingobium sp.]|nr:OB-fold domain-containing protein [Novosphingobium sp.]